MDRRIVSIFAILLPLLIPFAHALEVNLPVQYNPFDAPPYHIKIVLHGDFSDVNSVAFYDAQGRCLPIARLGIYPSKIIAFVKTDIRTTYIRAVFNETCETNESRYIWKRWLFSMINGPNFFSSVDPPFYFGKYVGARAIYNFEYYLLYFPSTGYSSNSMYIHSVKKLPSIQNSECAPTIFGSTDGYAYYDAPDINYVWGFNPDATEKNIIAPMIFIEYNGTQNPAPEVNVTITYQGNEVHLTVPFVNYWNGSQPWCANIQKFPRYNGIGYPLNNWLLTVRIKDNNLWKFYLIGYDNVNNKISAAVITYDPSNNTAHYVVSSTARNGVISPSSFHRVVVIKDVPNIERYVYILQQTRGIYVFDRQTDKLVKAFNPKNVTIISESEGYYAYDTNWFSVVNYSIQNAELTITKTQTKEPSPFKRLYTLFGAGTEWGFIGLSNYYSSNVAYLIKLIDLKATASDALPRIDYVFPRYTSEPLEITIDPLYHRVYLLLYRNGEVYESWTFAAFSGEQNINEYLPAGSYNLEIYQDGTLIDSKAFAVGTPPLDLEVYPDSYPKDGDIIWSLDDIVGVDLNVHFRITASALVVLSKKHPDGSRDKIADLGCFDAGEHYITGTYFLENESEYSIDYYLDYNGCNPYAPLFDSIDFAVQRGEGYSDTFLGNFSDYLNRGVDIINNIMAILFGILNAIFLNSLAFWLFVALLAAWEFHDEPKWAFAIFLGIMWLGYFLGFVDIWIALFITLLSFIVAEQKGYISLQGG